MCLWTLDTRQSLTWKWFRTPTKRSEKKKWSIICNYFLSHRDCPSPKAKSGARECLKTWTSGESRARQPAKTSIATSIDSKKRAKKKSHSRWLRSNGCKKAWLKNTPCPLKSLSSGMTGHGRAWWVCVSPPSERLYRKAALPFRQKPFFGEKLGSRHWSPRETWKASDKTLHLF